MNMTTIDLLKKTKAAWGSIRSANAEEKNRLLLAMAESLEANQADILRENQKDMDAARGSISDVMLDRLALTQARIHAMAEGIREAAALCPEEQLLCETDAPYMAPVPLRGEECEPAMVAFTLARLAEVREADGHARQSTYDACWRNTRRLFSL